MFTREVYPGNPHILFHYDGSDSGQPWPHVAPTGLSVASGLVLYNDQDLRGPHGPFSVAEEEATLLACWSTGVANQEIITRYADWFKLAPTRRSLLQKLGTTSLSRPDEATIAAGYQYGAYLPEKSPAWQAVRSDHRATILQLGRLFGSGRGCGTLRQIIGFSEEKIAYLSKRTLQDLGLAGIKRYACTITTLAGMSGALSQSGRPLSAEDLLQPLTDEELNRLLPSRTRIERPIGEEPSATVHLAGQHPDSELPDWNSGNITEFTYRGARFAVNNNPEVTGLAAKELSAWVLRCLGLSYADTVEMFGSKTAIEGAYRKLAPQASAREVYSPADRKHVLEQSVAVARKRQIIAPLSRPYLGNLSAVWRKRLVELTHFLGEGKQQAEIGRALQATRGYLVKRERVNQELYRLRELLRVAHDGQLMLLGEAERMV